MTQFIPMTIGVQERKFYPAPSPPSIGSSTPLMKSDWDEARKRTAFATSSGWAKRPVGILASLASRRGLAGHALSPIGVMVTVGAMLLV